VKRSTLVTAGVAFLCVLAVAFAAAALPNPQSGGGSLGNGTDSGGILGTTEPPAVSPIPDLPAWAQRLLLGLVAAGAVAGVVVTVKRPKEVLKHVVGVLAPLAVVLALFYLLDLILGAGGSGGGFGLFGSGDGSGISGEGGGTFGLDPVALLAIVAVVVLVGLVVARQFGGEERVFDVLGGAGETAAERTTASEALGSIAGETADRIERREDPPVENEVYRAWREMTHHLDVAFPETSTPAEFADAAVEEGMDRADVEELTALFRDVRYGGAEATPDREQRAVAVLRRIEDTYADG